MKFAITTDWRKTNGSSLVGLIEADYHTLVRAFGEPDREDQDKVQAEWRLEFEDGTIATIYDWKRYGSSPESCRDWHVGGFGVQSLVAVKEVLGL